jgi:hypothetical protein
MRKFWRRLNRRFLITHAQRRDHKETMARWAKADAEADRIDEKFFDWLKH